MIFRQKVCKLGRVKNDFSSETVIIMLGTNFSHDLGQKYFRKPKMENFKAFFHRVQAVQNFST